MRLTIFLAAFSLLLPAALGSATASAAAGWTHLTVPPMKTSIYFGSVTLTTGVLERHGATLTSTYVAKVFPWFFWGESGRIVIALTDAELARVAKGETVEFTGSAVNNRNKPRKVSGRAQPVDGASGKFKIRIMADGYQLIFNGTYHF